MRKILILLILLTSCTVTGTVKNFVGIPSITQITPHVFIGNKADAKNVDELKSFNIDAILNVAYEVDDPSLTGMLQKKIPMKEQHSFIALFQLMQAMNTIAFWSSHGHNVLVHCYLGENRSAWVVAHYLARTRGTTWRDEFANIKKLRPEVYIKGWMF